MDSSAGAARAVPRLVVVIVTVSPNFLQRYYNFVDLLELVMGLMFYISPAVGAKCSVRLTWDVFVRGLNRQLGTPSHWLPVKSCKEGQKGALAAVCTPTLKSASKKHQKLCTSVSEHCIWHSEGGKRKLCLVYISPSSKNLSLVPCA